ncbi:hypothetical protein H0H93_006616 [Arthromyces matolae]|nr:hypothetical protein H0H93_006616 [Arthromyces matolae]
MGEITDSTNVAYALAFTPLMWTTGTTMAPIIGGLLAQPATRWPDVFGKISLLHEFPYLLPCAVAGLISLSIAICGFLGLKETLPSVILQEKKKKAALERCSPPDDMTALLAGSNEQTYSATTTNGTVECAERGDGHTTAPTAPPSFRDILTPQLNLLLVICAFLVFTDMSLVVLQPLVYSTSVSLGGLGFSPHHIGSIMGTWGVTNVIFNLFGLPRLIRTFGERKVPLLVLGGVTLEFSLYPVLRWLVQRAGGVDAFVWAVLIVQLALALTHAAAYGKLPLSSDDCPYTELKTTLGAKMGLVQAVGSLGRAISPTVASSLFSISLERHLVAGNLVFIILSVISVFGLRLAFSLPKSIPPATSISM